MSDIDKLVSVTIDQWEQHDKFRDFANEGEPPAVRLAKAMRDERASRAALVADAQRWQKLMACERIRVIGSAKLGAPIAHIGLELWGKHPGKFDRSNWEAFTKFVDGLSPAGKGVTQ